MVSNIQVPTLCVPPLTGTPEQQRFTIRSGVLASMSSRQHCAFIGRPLRDRTDFGPKSLQLDRPTYDLILATFTYLFVLLYYAYIYYYYFASLFWFWTCIYCIEHSPLCPARTTVCHRQTDRQAYRQYHAKSCVEYDRLKMGEHAELFPQDSWRKSSACSPIFSRSDCSTHICVSQKKQQKSAAVVGHYYTGWDKKHSFTTDLPTDRR